MKAETLTVEEVERGWVEFSCSEHGFLVATTPKAEVACRCGRKAIRSAGGRAVDEAGRVTQAKPREFNKAGKVPRLVCPACQEDFGGRTTFRRHRVGGRGKPKRCLTPDEMRARGMRLSERGRWSQNYTKPIQDPDAYSFVEGLGAGR